MKIGLIGVGEVGSAYARALKDTDLKICDREQSGRPAATAGELDLTLHAAAGPWLADRDIVIAAVAGGDSPEAAAAALPHLPQHAVYIDVGTANPDDLRLSAAAYGAAGRDFVDGAIVGAIAISGAACPVLLSGPKADSVNPLFEHMEAPVTVLPQSAAGDASSLKLLRSVIIKGLECVAIESLTAAEHLGVRDRLMDAVQDVDAAGFVPFIEALVRTHVIHAGRRGHEMKDAAGQLHDLGFDGHVTQATPARYEATLLAGDPGAEAGNWDISEALDWLMQTTRKTEGTK
jgi:3-hydroxyisobutyrate dehydrogenase